MIKTLFLVLFTLFSALPLRAEDASYTARVKELAEAAESQATADATRLKAPAEKRRLEAETAQLIAEAQKLISEASLNEAKRTLLYQEVARLQQRMRITEYEFQRLVRADYELNSELAYVQRNIRSVRPLILGRASWTTWLALEELMVTIGDVEAMTEAIFGTTVGVLGANLFVPNHFSGSALEFPGGNLGELYEFARVNDLSFKKYSKSHQTILKIVAVMTKAADLKMQELRQINEAIRLTIGQID